MIHVQDKNTMTYNWAESRKEDYHDKVHGKYLAYTEGKLINEYKSIKQLELGQLNKNHTQTLSKVISITKNHKLP